MIHEAELQKESKLTYVEKQLGDAVVGKSEQL